MYSCKAFHVQHTRDTIWQPQLPHCILGLQPNARTTMHTVKCAPPHPVASLPGVPLCRYSHITNPHLSLKKESDSAKFLRPIEDLSETIAVLHGHERAAEIMACFTKNLHNSLLQTFFSLVAQYRKIGKLPQRTFAKFGIDSIIDEDMQPKILDVNTRPGIAVYHWRRGSVNKSEPWSIYHWQVHVYTHGYGVVCRTGLPCHCLNSHVVFTALAQVLIVATVQM